MPKKKTKKKTPSQNPFFIYLERKRVSLTGREHLGWEAGMQVIPDAYVNWFFSCFIEEKKTANWDNFDIFLVR